MDLRRLHGRGLGVGAVGEHRDDGAVRVGDDRRGAAAEQPAGADERPVPPDEAGRRFRKIPAPQKLTQKRGQWAQGRVSWYGV